MKDGKQRLSVVPSGRGTYAKQACSHCRKRKSKCDGRTPVCGPCEKAGRASECTWGKETAKKARTQQHFESLENYIRALESKVKDLQTDLESCRRNHGGPSPAASSDAAGNASGASVSRRADDSDIEELTDEGERSANSESDIEQLISPTRHLVLQESDHIEYHGPTSVWRLRAQRSSPAVSEAQGSVSPEPAPAVPSTYFDWSRHLPSEIPLSRSEHDRLIEILFKFGMTWSLRLIPDLFVRDMHRALSLPPNAPPPRLAHYSPMLHNAALALATAYSDDPVIKDMRNRRLYALRAKSYIEADTQKPTIALVTAFSTLAVFHSTCGEQSLGYLYFGMAGRISQVLGVKTDCSSWVKSGLITHADMLDRNWTYWTIFSQDVLWSLYVGRDFCLVPPREKPAFPVPYVGSEIDTKPWYWPPSKIPPQPGLVVRTFEVGCELMIIARRVYDFLNSTGPGSKRDGALQQVSELDIQLNNWKDSLTPEVDLTAASRPNALPHRLMIHLAYWWTLLLLHRPFHRRTKLSTASADIDHVKLCNRAGDNIMLLLGIWQEKYTLRYLPITLMQIIYCAGTSFIISAVQATSGPRLGRVALTTALSQAEQCIRYLLIAGKSFDCANEVASTLSNLLHDQLRPRLLMRTLEPKDILPPASAHERDASQGEYDYAQYGGGAVPGPNTAGPGDDALSLATTINNLDTLRDQCLFTVSSQAHTLGQPWPTGDALSLLSLQRPSSTSTTTTSTSPSTSAGPSTLFNGAAHAFTSPPQPLGRIPEDVEMDWGLGGGMGVDLSMMGGQPLSNRPYMGFAFEGLPAGNGFPDTDVPPPFEVRPSVPRPAGSGPGASAGAGTGAGAQPMHLDFSAEELAVMDQIMRQQFSQGMDYGISQQPRYDPLR